ncbi:HAD family hydrolase [Halobacterium litoreum]|uniref:HAD family hydrolase n=1 Tax=Halobacterium litoreum TaxID=2039234 RepID=A0ABD5NCU7_9EURY|nr:HAD family hydrolase [Halobacterium litoreum]UHH14002.1 HAD family hydrolase [Halobacterium litoreum]
MTVDAVCLDLDDTLVTYERSVGEVLALAFERAGVDPCFAASDYRAAYGDYADDADTVNELRRACFADLAADAGHGPETGRAVADAFAETRDQTRVECLPGARDLLDVLDVPLALVTNGAPEMQRQKLRGAGLTGAFDVVVFAGYDAPSKPDPEPFRRALAGLDATPENAVHVGDSVSSDVAGAHAAGLRSVWIHGDADRTPDPEPHRAFSDLHGVRAWLQST